MTTLGDRIHDLRRTAGYSLEKLAKEAGSSKGYIWELENKNPPRPSAHKLKAIADALGVSLDYLTNGGIDLEDARDRRFYAIYLSMDVRTKSKLRRIAKILKED